MNDYRIGSQPKIEARFRNEDRVLTDPTTVTFKVRAPSVVSDTGEVSYVYGTAPEVTKQGTGIYILTLTLNESGVWRYRAEGGGALVSAEDGALNCLMSAVLSP